MKPIRYLMFSTGVVLSSAAVTADEVAEKGRDILKRHSEAVVTVKMVIKEGMSFGGFGSQENETKSEATGTIIDPSGLTVLSLSETNPSGMFADLMSSMGDGGSDFQMSSQVTDVQIILADDSEIPAKIVLRDKDLDMAFARPLESSKKDLPYLDIGASGAPEILDPVFVLTRMGRMAQRSSRISPNRVEAVVDKPRTFFILGHSADSLGAPVFSSQGEVLGILFLRRFRAGGGMDFMSMLSSLGSFGMQGVVLPCRDILEAAEQAPEVEGSSEE